MIIYMRFYFIWVCFTLFFACSENRQSIQKNIRKKTEVPNHSNVLQDESFKVFIKKFHSDKHFMESRIAKIVTGFNSDDYVVDDTITGAFKWDKQDIIFYMHEVNDAYKSIKYIKKYTMLSAKEQEEYIYIPDSGCFYKCIFQFNEKWYLIGFIVNRL